MRLRIPPGRAGRLWLRERIVAARNAAELLDHKRRELEAELGRLGSITSRRQRDWDRAMAEAQQWLARVDATGGNRSLRLVEAMQTGRAEVTLEWRAVMGVRYPTDFSLSFPEKPAVAALDGGAALAFALDAYRRAVHAALAYATAEAALTRIRTDITRTVRRLRALDLRILPAHESALKSLELSLDEKDREDAIGASWAAEEIRTPAAGKGTR
jgi:V/A-type H+-transporting ATPase subunit D